MELALPVATPIKKHDVVIYATEVRGNGIEGQQGKFDSPQFLPHDTNVPLLVIDTKEFYVRPGAPEKEKKETAHLRWLKLFNKDKGMEVVGPSGNTCFASSWVEKMCSNDGP